MNAHRKWFDETRFAIVDIETTGMSPTADAITEIAVLQVAGGVVVDDWASLVNPGVPIPPEIQALTGITNEMVREAPGFDALAETLRQKLAGHVFVAHNARFDYGFLKNAFRRAACNFTADVLCTVRLSRKLYPEAREHGLDAVVMRHALQSADRHRARGDAWLAWRFVEHALGEMGVDAVVTAARALLKVPSYPAQLDAEAMSALPEGPGVYIFHGVNDLPLYIGKSVNIRDRVKSHFSADHRHANDVRLSMEIRRVSHEETAGELGALLRESQLVKQLLPLTNQRLRRNRQHVMIDLTADDRPPAIVKLTETDLGKPGRLFGPYSTRAGARAALMALAGENGLCWRALGVERSGALIGSACFARQLRHCAGCCEGVETLAAHHARLAEVLAERRFLPWPHEGPVAVAETHADGWREVHVFKQWRYLGSARDEVSLRQLALQPVPEDFDADHYRLIRQAVARAEADGQLMKLSDPCAFPDIFA